MVPRVDDYIHIIYYYMRRLTRRRGGEDKRKRMMDDGMIIFVVKKYALFLYSIQRFTLSFVPAKTFSHLIYIYAMQEGAKHLDDLEEEVNQDIYSRICGGIAYCFVCCCCSLCGRDQAE